MIKELTKQQRLEMYSKMIEIFKNGDYTFLCPCARKSGDLLGYFDYYDFGNQEVIELLPELASHRPKAIVKSETEIWFEDGIDPRIKVLENCIKQLS